MLPVVDTGSCIKKPEEWAKVMAEAEEEKRQREKGKKKKQQRPTR
jgi:hypothetical protein